MLPFMKTLVRNVFQGPATEEFPFAEAHTPKRFRGRAELDPERCLACGICSHVCAGGAISMKESPDSSGVEFRLWHNTCAFCGLCEHYCPAKAIRMTNDWHMSHEQSEKYSCCEVKFIEFPVCGECGQSMLPHLKNRLVKGMVGSVEASEIMRLCPDCRRRLSAACQVKGTSFITAERS